MKNWGVKVIGGVVALAAWSFSSGKYSENGDYYIDPEIDAYVEEVYVQDDTTRLVPLGSWFAESEENDIYLVGRSTAAAMSEALQAKFGIELLACVDTEYEMNETSVLLGKIRGIEDIDGVAQLLRTAVPDDASIEVGKTWMEIDIY